LDELFLLDLLLDLAIVTAIDENALPPAPLIIDVAALPVHQSVGPLTFIGGAIRVYQGAFALHFILGPLAGVDCPRREVVPTITMHLVLNPVTFVGLALETTVCHRRFKLNLAVTMLKFIPVE